MNESHRVSVDKKNEENVITPEGQAEIQTLIKNEKENIESINSMLEGGQIEKMEPTKLLKIIDFIKDKKEIFIGIGLIVGGATMVVDGIVNHRWEVENMDVRFTAEGIKAALGGFMTVIGLALSSNKVMLPKTGFNG